MNKLFLLFFLILSVNTTLFAQQTDSLAMEYQHLRLQTVQTYKISKNLNFEYQKPKFWEFVTNIPSDFGIFGKMFVQKNNLIWFGSALGATAALVPIDQQLTNQARDFGEQIGLNEAHSYSGPIKMFPNDVNSGIYRLGNGFTALMVSGGLLTFGLLKNDYRAIHTSSELVEGLIASGLVVQPLKRITGRESPFVAEQNGHPGGEWNPFPSFAAYAKSTPNYDAMPSGHLTTLMTTLTILSENYKEKKWIKPVGYGLMGLMAFEMVQSKVHWTSDYPLAVFMGYMIGKSIVKNRVVQKKITTTGTNKTVLPKLYYTFDVNQNFSMIGIQMKF